MNLKDLDVLNYRIKTMQNQSMVIAYKSAIFGIGVTSSVFTLHVSKIYTPFKRQKLYFMKSCLYLVLDKKSLRICLLVSTSLKKC